MPHPVAVFVLMTAYTRMPCRLRLRTCAVAPHTGTLASVFPYRSDMTEASSMPVHGDGFGATDEPQPEPQLLLGLPLPVLHALLEQLEHNSKLALLHTCKALQQAVLQHATKLSFTISRKATATQGIKPLGQQTTQGLLDLLANRTAAACNVLRAALGPLLREQSGDCHAGGACLGNACTRRVVFMKQAV